MISGACSPPSPSSPWQVAHFASKMFFPFEDSELRSEPRPGADPSLFGAGFWQTAAPIAPKDTSISPSAQTIRQITWLFSQSAPKDTFADDGSTNGEPDIPQNLLDANQIIAFDWFWFRSVKTWKTLCSGHTEAVPGVRISSDHSRDMYHGSADRGRGHDAALLGGFTLMVVKPE